MCCRNMGLQPRHQPGYVLHFGPVLVVVMGRRVIPLKEWNGHSVSNGLRQRLGNMAYQQSKARKVGK